jgi:AcrR family transcriptional regulator
VTESIPRVTRRRPTRAQTRRQLLDAAFAVFRRQGIANTSLADIAGAAGLTKGAVYSNFASKDELLLAIMEDHLIERMRNATEVFEGAAETAEAVREAGARLLAGVLSDADWHRLLLEYWTIAVHDPPVLARLADRRRELRAAVAKVIATAVRERNITLPIAPEELAVTLLALSNGLAVERSIDASAVPDDLFEKLLTLLVQP